MQNSYIIEDQLILCKEIIRVLARRIVAFRTEKSCPPLKNRPLECSKVCATDSRCVSCWETYAKKLALKNLAKHGIKLRKRYFGNA